MDLRETILSQFKSGKLNNKTQNEIISTLRLPSQYKKPAKAVLKKLAEDCEIIKTNSGRYVHISKCRAFRATVKANAGGFAFLIPEGCAEREHDYFAGARNLHGALNKDTVLAMPTGSDEARVLKILERGTKRVVGRVENAGRFFVLVPDDRAFAAEVIIHPSLTAGAEDGDKAVAEICDYTPNCVRGRVCAILGKSGELFTEEDAIIAAASLNTEFPTYVEETAQKVASQPITIDERRDLRDTLTVTIDGDDTRDIDDAVSLEIGDGTYILGVHIADVSKYVKYNGCIDKEAYERGTSVYFPDRVLPMLPKALSNGACSLNEGEDRYAMSCIMTFDEKGKRTKYEICESVIKSDKRMTYNEVTRILEDNAFAAQYGRIAEMLRNMAGLCALLKARRASHGEVDLEVKEAHIYLDERGEICIPDDCERALSHEIIEQFMIAANEAVADFAQKKHATFLYRVHEKPAPEKAATLFGFVGGLGIKSNASPQDATPRDYRKIMLAAEGKPYLSVVSKVMLRSMQKARYCEENLGHFGLASECYCHFTSPIRRYPDLFIHRELKRLLHGEEGNIRINPEVKEAAANTSACERVAEQAERDVDDLYKVVYMQKHIGKVYEAVISGVVESGIFAQLENTVEGMVRYTDLPADDYEFYPERFMLKGMHKTFKLGDKVNVKVIACDIGTRKIQFVLA